MKIEIKLKDPKMCEGCPALDKYFDNYGRCPILGEENRYFIIKNIIWNWKLPNFPLYIIKIFGRYKVIRPKECIERYGL